MELAALPADFGSKYEGQVLRHRFDTGWSRGVIKKLIKKNDERQEYNVLCAFPDTSGRADREMRVKLRGALYRVERTSPPSSWHLLLWVRADSGEGSEGQAAQDLALDRGKRHRA